MTRMLALIHSGTNSRDIFLDAIRGFELAGVEVIRCDLGPIATIQQQARTADPQSQIALSRQISAHIERLCKDNRCDCSIAMWAMGIFTAGLEAVNGPTGERRVSMFERAGLPHVAFWLDAPHWAHEGSLGPLLNDRDRGPFAWPGMTHVINNAATGDEMKRVMGFGRVLARPYGINETLFSPDQAHGIEPEFDVVFGSGPGDPGPTGVMLEELKKDEPDIEAIRDHRALGLEKKIDTEIDEAMRTSRVDRDAAHALGRAMLDAQRTAPSKPMLDRLHAIANEDAALKDAASAIVQNAPAFIRITDFVRRMDRWRRAFTLTHLSMRTKCAVFGPVNLTKWPHEATLLGPLEYQDMTRAYARGRVGLNAMRWQDEAGFNLKPLEIAASGVACVSETRVGLDEAFTIDKEIAIFESPATATSVVRGLLDRDADRKAMAEAGRARVLSEHTWTHWARDVVDFTLGGK